MFPLVEQLTLPPTGTLRQAMHILDQRAVAIALVVDEAGKLLGTLTDGDIRRSLLQGSDLDAPVQPHMQTHFTSVPAEADRAWVLDLMRARSIQQIPILAGDGRLAGLHLMRELLGMEERPEWAVIMAGGEGKRLRPLTQRIPKPMVHVAGRPILERLVLHLVGYGIRRVFLAIHYLGEVIESYFGDGAQFGCKIEYLRESQPLDTAGALSMLPQRPEHSVLVLNGDLVTQGNMRALLDFHCQGGQAATLCVRDYWHVVPFGCVAAENGRLKAFQEKPCLTARINAGIYVMNPEILNRLPRSTACTMPGILSDCLQRGEDVRIFPLEDEWQDIGRPEQLQEARGHAAG